LSGKLSDLPLNRVIGYDTRAVSVEPKSGLINSRHGNTEGTLETIQGRRRDYTHAS